MENEGKPVDDERRGKRMHDYTQRSPTDQKSHDAVSQTLVLWHKKRVKAERQNTLRAETSRVTREH